MNANSADNPVLSPTENQLLRDAGADPHDFGVLAGQAQVDARQQMGIGQVQTPNGVVECLIVPLLLLVPIDRLRPRSTIVDASGRTPNPVEGMIPVLQVRALVPKERLAVRPTLVVPPNGDFPEDPEDPN